MRHVSLLALALFACSCAKPDHCQRIAALAREGKIEQRDCGVTRGSKQEKKLAFVFTAGSFCEGVPTFLDTLKEHRGKASFFLLTEATQKCADVLPRIIGEGHYVGPHSDTHPELVDRQGGATRVTREFLDGELERNVAALRRAGVRGDIRYWIPPSEEFNAQIASWSAGKGFITVHMTECPLTRGDYLPVTAQNGRFSNDAILERIFACKARDGMNGAILFLHAGVGPSREDKDKFHQAFPKLVNTLASDGFSFVRIDELLRL
jgi:peptidoglycan/xylan/chitin deacetylase (PgdA/CDA1 family)